MKSRISIIGLGYVGLPLAVSLAKFYNVYGFDISRSRIEELKNGIDKNKEILKKNIINKDLNFFHIKNIENYSADVFIVTVPTPVYSNLKPNLTFLSFPQDDKTKCWNCKKKVGLLGVQCRCEYVFCSKHRYPEEHACDFNFD